MKIRLGFVSNSSSSSFACAIKKEDYVKAIGELSKIDQDIINRAETPGSKIIDGVEIMVVFGVTGDEPTLNGRWYEEDYDNQEEYEAISDAMDNLLYQIGKYGLCVKDI